MKLYHASTLEIKKPQWDFARDDESNLSDFGVGFYLGTDAEQPIKLLCSVENVVLNAYDLNETGLKILKQDLDVEWLLTVAFHRRNFAKKTDIHALRDAYRAKIADQDVVCGPIANDRMFSTIQLFIDSILTDTVTLASMNVMNYSHQYVLKSNKACNNLTFLKSTQIERNEIERYRTLVFNERSQMDDKLEQIREDCSGTGRLFRQIIKERLQ
ncbi:MAG: DUF3990 domain-containing protein [Thermoguttaceae bacterium]